MKMNDVIRHNKKVGQHFFDKETMKYWGSRVETELFPNNTFVTSEDTYDRNGRLYTVRMYDPNTGRIKTLNSFQEFDNLRDAENFAKNYSGVKSSRKVQRKVMASENDVYNVFNGYLSDLSIDELVDIYNQIVLKGNQNGWHYIYSMYDFEDVVTQDRTAIDVIFELYDPIKRGLFNPNDEYFYFDRKDKIESFSDIMALECPIYIPEISEYIYDNDDDFGYEGIAKILSMFN